MKNTLQYAVANIKKVIKQAQPDHDPTYSPAKGEKVVILSASEAKVLNELKAWCISAQKLIEAADTQDVEIVGSLRKLTGIINEARPNLQIAKKTAKKVKVQPGAVAAFFGAKATEETQEGIEVVDTDLSAFLKDALECIQIEKVKNEGLAQADGTIKRLEKERDFLNETVRVLRSDLDATRAELRELTRANATGVNDSRIPRSPSGGYSSRGMIPPHLQTSPEYDEDLKNFNQIVIPARRKVIKDLCAFYQLNKSNDLQKVIKHIIYKLILTTLMSYDKRNIEAEIYLLKNNFSGIQGIKDILQLLEDHNELNHDKEQIAINGGLEKLIQPAQRNNGNGTPIIQTLKIFRNLCGRGYLLPKDEGFVREVLGPKIEVIVAENKTGKNDQREIASYAKLTESIMSYLNSRLVPAPAAAVVPVP